MKELETIEGIGPKTKELLNKIKIYAVEDLLNYYPYRYDIIKRSDLSNLSDGDKIIIDGIVEGQPTTIYINKSLKKMIFRISTKTMILNITLYNRTHLYSDLKSGKEYTSRLLKYPFFFNSFLTILVISSVLSFLISLGSFLKFFIIL